MCVAQNLCIETLLALVETLLAAISLLLEVRVLASPFPLGGFLCDISSFGSDRYFSNLQKNIRIVKQISFNINYTMFTRSFQIKF